MPAASREIPLTPFGDALAGAIGAVLANAAVYPLDIVKTRLQVQKTKEVGLDANAVQPVHYNSAVDALTKIIKSEGISGLYTGMAGGLIGTATQNFAYFYWYTFVRDAYTARIPLISTPMELVLGALAGALATIFTIPIGVCTTRQQTASIIMRKSLIETAREIIGEDGITGLWRGLKPSLILCSNPAITYGVFAVLKKRIVGTGKLTPAQAFTIGAMCKTIATVVTYPYIMAKVRMQHKSEDPAFDERGLGAITILRKIYRETGFTGLYKGMDTQISKAVLTQAILFYFREICTKYTIIAFAYIRTLQQRRFALTK